MKTIVVTGAQAKVGKTTLALKLREVVPEAEVVKIGHGKVKPDMPNHFYPHDTPWAQIREKHRQAQWLVIESNSILKELKPDLAIFLEGEEYKPSARLAKEKADIISGQLVDSNRTAAWARHLGLREEAVRRIIWLAGARPEPATLIILAGGKSSRLGQDKTRLKVGDKTLLRHLQDDLGPGFDQIIISTGGKGMETAGRAEVVKDQQPGQGPLMGIYSAVAASRHRVNFVVACDIPEVHRGVVRDALSWSGTYDIVLPSFEEGLVEPLLAVYTKAVLPEARKLFDENKRKISFLFSKCRTHIIRIAEKKWYFNVNTPDDLKHFLNTRKAGI